MDIEEDDFASAMPHLERVIALKPDVAWAHGQLGLVYVQRGALDAARRSFAAALELEPRNAAVNYYSGMVEASQSQWQAAESKFVRAIESEAGFAEAHVALAKRSSSSDASTMPSRRSNARSGMGLGRPMFRRPSA